MGRLIHLHPDYKECEDLIRQIPEGKYEPTKTFCNRRNTVELVMCGGKAFVVKRYKRPTWANCLVYTWWRKTKARRAYEYAVEMLARGFETAFPVAYIEERRWGIFHTGWFVSEYLPYPLLKDVPQMDLPEQEKLQIADDFIHYTASLHEQGILPCDYNSGNIFFHKEGGRYRFALIDINRMQIGHTPGERQSARFFDQMGVSISQAIGAIDQYASLRGFDADRQIFFILVHRMKKQWERSLKKHILHPLVSRK